jgi:hypothetical protein
MAFGMWRASSKLSSMQTLTHWALVQTVAWRRLTLVPEGQVGGWSLGGKKIMEVQPTGCRNGKVGGCQVVSSFIVVGQLRFVSSSPPRVARGSGSCLSCRGVGVAWRDGGERREGGKRSKQRL